MKLRKRFIVWLFEVSQRLYTRYWKRCEPWNTNKHELITYPENSFGKALGKFLYAQGFDLIPKVERHDAYHVITDFGSRVEDEIALQYLCFGNGKRSLYLFGVILAGTVLLPEYVRYYSRAFRLGTQAHPFHSLPFQKLLHVPLEDIQAMVFPCGLLKRMKDIQNHTSYKHQLLT